MRTTDNFFITPFQTDTVDRVTYTQTAATPRDLTTIRRDMGDYLPRYYGDFPVAANLIDREASEIADLNAEIYDVLAQFFIDTATWGLANWERICGVTIDEMKPYDQRRSVIKAKLRGIGTVTVALIKSVAESFNNGEVDITEDTANYTIAVRYISALGVPDNIADIEKALRDIIPAHLGIRYDYRYLFINEVHSVMTLTTIAATKLNKFAPFKEIL